MIRKLCAAALCLCLMAFLLSGCTSSKKEAVQTLENYLNRLIAGQYAEAYALLSDFDRGNISEESFILWQQEVSQIAKGKSFTVDGKIDTFKNYKYLGTEFGTVYGLKVDRTQEALLPDVEMSGYDSANFRIMVQMQKDGARVLLLITNPDEIIATYKAYLEKLQ